jgi:hypothetical protein
VAEGIGQSPEELDVDDAAVSELLLEPPDELLSEPLSLDPPLSEPLPPSAEPSPPELDAEVDDEPAFAARRSFFAQPDPLKWIAGAANALRTGPLPQSGQLVGPASLRPWITSKRRPQAAQT